MTLSFMIGADANLPHDYLPSQPEHDQSFADRLLEIFGFKLSNFEYRDSVKLRFTGSSSTEIGAYEKAFIFADRKIGKCCTPHDDGLLEKALNIFPQGTLFLLYSHDGTNLFRYRLFEQGKLVRDHGGDFNDGVTVDYGQLLPEEQPAFANSKIIDGQRIFYDTRNVRGKPVIEEYTVDAYGEKLGLDVAARFFGERKDPRHSKLPTNLTGECFA